MVNLLKSTTIEQNNRACSQKNFELKLFFSDPSLNFRKSQQKLEDNNDFYGFNREKTIGGGGRFGPPPSLGRVKCFYGVHIVKHLLYSFYEIMFRVLVFIGTFQGS